MVTVSTGHLSIAANVWVTCITTYYCLVGGGGATGVSKSSSHLLRSDTAEMEMEGGKYEYQMDQVQRNRREIERMREIVADHFASQVANECHVQ